MAKKSKSSLNKKVTFSGAQVLLFVLAFAAVGAVAVWQSLAAPHNGGGAAYSGSLSLVMKNDINNDGLPNYGDTVTFDVKSTSPYPMVNLSCYQGTTQVDNQNVGFYPGWVWSQDFLLSHWYYWKSGGADCKATLYYQTKKGNVTMAAMSFHVND